MVLEVKHPQCTFSPRAVLKTSAEKKANRRKFASTTAPGSKNPKIMHNPINNSIQGKTIATGLMSTVGSIW